MQSATAPAGPLTSSWWPNARTAATSRACLRVYRDRATDGSSAWHAGGGNRRADDDLILAWAIASELEVLVSGDRKHLLPVGERGGVRILTPQALLAELPGE